MVKIKHNYTSESLSPYLSTLAPSLLPFSPPSPLSPPPPSLSLSCLSEPTILPVLHEQQVDSFREFSDSIKPLDLSNNRVLPGLERDKVKES